MTFSHLTVLNISLIAYDLPCSYNLNPRVVIKLGNFDYLN